MPTRGTALTEGQMAEFVGAGTKALILIANQLGPDLTHNWAREGEAMQRAFLGVLMPPPTVLTESFVRDMRKENWKLLEHAPRRIVSIANLELVPFLKSGESSIGGEEMVRRARTELDANYSQEDAEFLLEHQAEIPQEFRKYILVFTATVWRGSDGFRSVSYLYWGGGRWFLAFLWLGRDWDSYARLLRPRK